MGMRSDASDGDIQRAVARCLIATFDRGKWLELGLITGTTESIQGHSRLLRSLTFGDDDYDGCVLAMVPVVIGRVKAQDADPWGGEATPITYAHLAEVEEYLELESWLRANEPGLHAKLYAGLGAAGVDDLQEAATRLGVRDVEEHAARIRLGLAKDPAQAIGSAKELLETVLKGILGLHGNGPETQVDVPKLMKDASVQLGLHAGGHRDGEPGSEQRRKLYSSLSSIVISAAELRNAGFGTGHGGSQRPELDLATARMVVSSAVAVATFYIEAYAAQNADRPVAKDSATPF